MWSVAAARGTLARDRARAARWDEQLRTIDALSEQAPDLSKLYPYPAFLKSDLEKLVDRVWGVTPNDAKPIIVSDAKLKRAFPDSPIEERYVECTAASGVSLERFMQFVNGAVAWKADSPTFVSHLQLTPIQSSADWRATVRISVYQVVRELAGSAE
nr:hypothetical protein [uncultured bacterium]